MNTSFQIKGTLHSVKETQQVSDKFSKREFVLTTEEDSPYPQKIQFEFQNDRCDIIDAYHVGQSVTVDFLLRGKEWTNQQGEVKTFLTLVAWKIQPANI